MRNGSGPAGAMESGTWINSGSSWYYLMASGAMATSMWVGDYYLKADGTMATGWAQDGATWYRFSGNGRLASRYNPGTYTCPSWAQIKGNGESKIYHRPGQT